MTVNIFINEKLNYLFSWASTTRCFIKIIVALSVLKLFAFSDTVSLRNVSKDIRLPTCDYGIIYNDTCQTMHLSNGKKIYHLFVDLESALQV